MTIKEFYDKLNSGLERNSFYQPSTAKGVNEDDDVSKYLKSLYGEKHAKSLEWLEMDV